MHLVSPVIRDCNTRGVRIVPSSVRQAANPAIIERNRSIRGQKTRGCGKIRCLWRCSPIFPGSKTCLSLSAPRARRKARSDRDKSDQKTGGAFRARRSGKNLSHNCPLAIPIARRGVHKKNSISRMRIAAERVSVGQAQRFAAWNYLQPVCQRL